MYLLLHFSVILQVWKILLAQSLKDCHSHTVAEVQTSGLFPHGDTHTILIMLRKESLRQALGFLPEKQVAILAIVCLGIASGSLGAEQAHLLHGIPLKKILQRRVYPNIHQIPIIQPRTLHGGGRNIKAQRLDQMQYRPGGGTGTGNIPGVLRDLRLHQYNVQHSFIHDLTGYRFHDNVYPHYSMINRDKIQHFFLKFQKKFIVFPNIDFALAFCGVFEYT